MNTNGLQCLLCKAQLTAENSAEEHIIPNAIGGQIWTKNATCSKCNSQAGHAIDNKLVSAFGLLANALDVPRDRGAHPDAHPKDDSTSKRYKLSPGKKPVLDHNISVRREPDGTLHYSFYAPTREEAERILRSALPRKKKVKIESFTGIERPGEQYNLALVSVSLLDTAILRAVTKIAATYARYQGFALPCEAVGPRYLRNEPTTIAPVAAALSDVVSLADLPAQPLYHSIFIHKPQGSRQLFSYVCLFQAFDFVVLLDEDCDAPSCSAGYLWNIVTGSAESRTFRWIAAPSELVQWFGQNSPPVERAKAMAASLVYWIKNLRAIWIQRALTAGMKTFIRRIDEGAKVEAAAAAMNLEMAKRLAPYDLTIGEITITGC